MAAYGVGTAPRLTRAIAPVVRRAIDNGTEVVVVTQRDGLIDLDLYENSRASLMRAPCPAVKCASKPPPSK